MYTRPIRPTKRTALITGGSSGIGYELSRLFAARGYSIILVARNRKRLDDAARELRAAFASTVIPIVLDLSRPSAPERLLAILAKRRLRIDVLVNNAGAATYGSFAAGDIGADRDLLQLNVVALTLLTKLILRGMLERHSGRILNVSSAAAFQPGPLRATYFASKAYVLSLTEAIAEEVRGSGVTVSALCPGPTATNLLIRAGMAGTPWAGAPRMDPRAVADAGFAGVMAGRVVIIPGLRNRLLSHIVHVVPRKVTRRIVKKMHEKRSDR